MFKWLFGIAVGFLAVKLAETYKRPSATSRERSFPDRPASKPRRKTEDAPRTAPTSKDR